MSCKTAIKTIIKYIEGSSEKAFIIIDIQVLLCFLLHELRIIVNSPDCYHINKFQKTLYIMYK